MSEEVLRLERELAELSHLVTCLQQELRKAGEYKNDDPAKELEGTKILLVRAGEAKGRKARGRRR